MFTGASVDQSYLERAAKMADRVRGLPSQEDRWVTAEAVLGALARTRRHIFIGVHDLELAGHRGGSEVMRRTPARTNIVLPFGAKGRRQVKKSR